MNECGGENENNNNKNKKKMSKMKTTIYSYHKRGKKNHFLFLCVIFFFSHFL